MSYIDKIKKDGVVYDIRGKSSGGQAAGSASGIIEFEPIADEQDYQILDGFYTQPLVTAIKYTDKLYPLICNRYPQGQEAFEGGDNRSFSVFLGSVEATSENSADIEIFILCYYKLLAHIQTNISIECDAETGDTWIVLGDLTVSGLTDDVLAELRSSIEDSLISTWTLNGGALSGEETPEFSLDDIRYMLSDGCFYCFDSEAIKKFIGEPQVETGMEV